MEQNMQRVANLIAPAILEFCATPKIFRGDDLRKFVIDRCGLIAPGSPDRILRLLRKQEKLNYKVISRSKSLYEVF